KAVIKSTVVMGSSVPGRVARSNSVEEFHDHCNTADASHYLVCKQLTPLVAKGEVVRRIAIHIAEACTLHVLQDTLADIAFDPSQPLTIRVSAAYAACNYGDENTKAKLKPLAVGTAGEDTNDELKGCGLLAVWPTHMTVEELFAILSSSNESYPIGIYQ